MRVCITPPLGGEKSKSRLQNRRIKSSEGLYSKEKRTIYAKQRSGTI